MRNSSGSEPSEVSCSRWKFCAPSYRERGDRHGRHFPGVSRYGLGRDPVAECPEHGGEKWVVVIEIDDLVRGKAAGDEATVEGPKRGGIEPPLRQDFGGTVEDLGRPRPDRLGLEAQTRHGPQIVD